MTMVLKAYPPARIPLRPVLATSEVSLGAPSSPYPSVLQAGNTALVTSGRVAVALALKELRLAPGDEVLIPAYHCSSMVEPAIWAGASPVFFRMGSDASPDLADVLGKLGKRSRALLMPHYFGFPQDMPQIRQFCDQHNIALIEDCAHAFYGSIGGRPLGSYGDYACASPWKFFPAYDGGCLVSARHSLAHIGLKSAGWRYETKSAVNALEQSFEYGRLPLVRTVLNLPLRAKNTMLRILKSQRAHPAPDIGPSALEGGFSFEPGWVDKRMSLVSRALIRVAPGEHIASARRHNYLHLRDALSDLPGVHAFRRDLPQGMVPHVFPLFVDNPDVVFPELRRQAVPMLRFGEWLWPGVDASVCPTSMKLSRHLAQFPCHQGLAADELDWLVARIRETLTKSGPRVQSPGWSA